jgi:hypothetical protein
MPFEMASAGPLGVGGGDEFIIRSGARAEAGKMTRVVPRRQDHANFYIVDVVELAFRGENLIEFGRIRFFNIDDRETLLSCRDVSVSARNVNVAGIFDGDESAADWFWLREIGDGVDQDDYVTSGGTKGFEAPTNIRADQIMDQGVRLPYFKFPRNPTN